MKERVHLSCKPITKTGLVGGLYTDRSTIQLEGQVGGLYTGISTIILYLKTVILFNYSFRRYSQTSPYCSAAAIAALQNTCP